MRNIYEEYEKRKAEIRANNPSADEYDIMIAKVIKELGI